jgi:hypothetical protein
MVEGEPGLWDALEWWYHDTERRVAEATNEANLGGHL